MLTDDADRPLPPTERHRREAKLRGIVAFSPELTSAIVLLVSSTLLWWLGPRWVSESTQAMRLALTNPSIEAISIPKLSALAWMIGQNVAVILLPIVIAVFATAILMNLLQTGWMWNPSRLTPRLRLTNPLSTDRWLDAFGLICRIAIVAAIVWMFLLSNQWKLASFGLEEPAIQVAEFIRMVGEVLIRVSAGLLLLAFFDYGIRYWQNERRLRMTVEERRREQQEESINPRFKQRAH